MEPQAQKESGREIIVRSSDGVDVVVHDLDRPSTPPRSMRPALLIAHATGFHGRAYQQLAIALADHWHCWAFDFRGHGATRQPPDVAVDWQRYADDTTAVAEHLAQLVGQPVDGFGHSMGGATLLMAADRRPELFRRLALFEPIVFPPRPPGDPHNPLAAGARRRRWMFASRDDAYAMYASKRPLNVMTPEALDDYVRHGFVDVDIDDTASPAVRLACDPEIEAQSFEMGGNHNTWSRLAHIETPTLVLGGCHEPDAPGPAGIVDAVAERLVNGVAHHIETVDHFGPMSHPQLVANDVSEFLSRPAPR